MPVVRWEGIVASEPMYCVRGIVHVINLYLLIRTSNSFSYFAISLFPLSSLLPFHLVKSYVILSMLHVNIFQHSLTTTLNCNNVVLSLLYANVTVHKRNFQPWSLFNISLTFRNSSAGRMTTGSNFKHAQNIARFCFASKWLDLELKCFIVYYPLNS